MALAQLQASTEYVVASVTADHDITGDVIQVSFPTKGAQPTTWVNTTVLGVVAAAGQYTASFRILLGPNGGDTQLSAGTYDAYVKVVDNPEQPVRKFDSVTIS